MLHYCKKCGRILQQYKGDIRGYKCDCCQSVTYPVPQKYLLEGFDVAFKDKESEQLLIEELVKTSPEFDQYLFDHRDEILSQKHEEFQAKMVHGKAVLEGRDKGNSYGITCPYCHATNVRKISIASRAVSTGLFGFANKKIGKQWHCNHCGSDF